MRFYLPADIQNATSLEEAARLLGEFLDLRSPAPATATKRAIEDPEFAKALVATRKLPHVRDSLLNQATPGTAKLVSKASKSLLKWGMEGMKPAPPWVIERRLAACNQCVYQEPAPDTLLYRGAKIAVGKDSKICNVCQCLTNTKAAIATELCPVPNPKDPKKSKWGEEWVDPELHPKGPW